MKQKDRVSFYKRLQIFKRHINLETYPFSEYIDDCAKRRIQLSGKDLQGLKFSWLTKNEISLIIYHLDEFEIWLKLQV